MAIGGVLTGIFGALLGLGGGIFIIPMLTLIFDMPIHVAIGTSLVGVIATSSGAASTYVRSHLSDIRLGLTLEVASSFGAVIGGLVAGFLDRDVLGILFALLLLYTALSMARPLSAEQKRRERSFDYESISNSSYQPQKMPLGFVGSFFAGNISGLLGVGGGFIKVPL